MSCRGLTINTWIGKERMEEILVERGYHIQTFDEVLLDSGYDFKDFKELDYNTRKWKFAWKTRLEKEQLQSELLKLVPRMEERLNLGYRGSWLFDTAYDLKVSHFLANNVCRRICNQIIKESL